MTIKVTAICSSEATLAALDAPDPARTGMVFAAQTGSVHTLASVLQRDHPDVALLELPEADEQAMELIEVALIKEPGTHIVLVSPDRSVEFMKRAMRAGVREVVPAPLTPKIVRQSIANLHRELLGKVLAMVPAKGGAGATFLVTNLAYALSRQGKRVAVLDLNLYFGDAAIFLGDKKVVSSLVDLARQAQRLDSSLLNSSMIKVSDSLHLLGASESPEDASEVSTAAVERIIELARCSYDFVLLDVSSTLDQIAIKALDLADTIYLTLQLNLPFVRAAKDMAAVFRQLGYSGEKLSVIVNRYEKGDTISLGDVETATLLKIGRTIPNSHIAASASVNQGIPILQMAPRDPVTRALLAWAQELAPGEAEQNKGWWQQLMSPSS